MSTAWITREEIFKISARHDWEALQYLVDAMSPETHGETYYVGLVHLQFPTWTSGFLSEPARICRSVLRKSRDPYVLSLAYTYLGEMYEFSGDIEKSEEFLRKGWEYADHPGLVGNAKNCLALLYFNLGLFTTAERYYREANEIARHLLVTIYSKIGIARCLIRRGRLPHARRWLSCAASVIDRYAEYFLADQEIQIRVGRGEYWSSAGRLDRALEEFDAGEFKAIASRRPRYQVRVMEARARALIDHGEHAAEAEVARFLERAHATGIRQAVDRARALEVELALKQRRSPSEVQRLCARIQDPGQRFIALSRTRHLGENGCLDFELNRLGCNMPSATLAEMREAHLA